MAGPGASTPARTASAGEPRGAARRRALRAAVVRLIGQGGIAAVDHRAVAAEAGVPLGSTTYYFASKAEMIASALASAADGEAERLRARRDSGALEVAPEDVPARLADVFLHAWEMDRTTQIAQFELYLEAARNPELRPAAERWDSAYRDLIAAALERAGVADAARRAPIVSASLVGLLLDHVAGNSSPAELRDQVVELIARFAAA
ncbi:MAG: TetR family transcriptional regulator [Solirubrobacterales bacterium]|nr:TetR family transcriptional regulator [Solirubrobacterales bacterium]